MYLPAFCGKFLSACQEIQEESTQCALPSSSSPALPLPLPSLRPRWPGEHLRILCPVHPRGFYADFLVECLRELRSEEVSLARRDRAAGEHVVLLGSDGGCYAGFALRFWSEGPICGLPRRTAHASWQRWMTSRERTYRIQGAELFGLRLNGRGLDSDFLFRHLAASSHIAMHMLVVYAPHNSQGAARFPGQARSLVVMQTE